MHPRPLHTMHCLIGCCLMTLRAFHQRRSLTSTSTISAALHIQLVIHSHRRPPLPPSFPSLLRLTTQRSHALSRRRMLMLQRQTCPLTRRALRGSKAASGSIRSGARRASLSAISLRPRDDAVVVEGARIPVPLKALSNGSVRASHRSATDVRRSLRSRSHRGWRAIVGIAWSITGGCRGSHSC